MKSSKSTLLLVALLAFALPASSMAIPPFMKKMMEKKRASLGLGGTQTQRTTRVQTYSSQPGVKLQAYTTRPTVRIQTFPSQPSTNIQRIPPTNIQRIPSTNIQRIPVAPQNSFQRTQTFSQGLNLPDLKPQVKLYGVPTPYRQGLWAVNMQIIVRNLGSAPVRTQFNSKIEVLDNNGNRMSFALDQKPNAASSFSIDKTWSLGSERTLQNQIVINGKNQFQPGTAVANLTLLLPFNPSVASFQVKASVDSALFGNQSGSVQESNEFNNVAIFRK